PQNLEVNINFQGREKDKYSTGFVGLTAINDINKNLRLKWMLSYFEDNERENMDINSSYIFGEREIDENSSSFDNIINPLGKGQYQDFSRNSLYIRLLNAQHKGSLDAGKHYLQWGNAIEQQTIRDGINEWQYNDSAGYSLPYTPGGNLELSDVVKSNAAINITRFSGYL